MATSTILSLIAVTISLGSAGISLWSLLRDRPHLQLRSNFADEFGLQITFKAVNKGRRPVVLRLFGGDYENSEWSGICLGEHEGGLRLGEKDFFEKIIYAGGDMCKDLEGNSLIRVWIEDSTGRRYYFKKSAEQVERLLREEGSKKEH
jgi:hypothetical protein